MKPGFTTLFVTRVTKEYNEPAARPVHTLRAWRPCRRPAPASRQARSRSVTCRHICPSSTASSPGRSR